MIDCSTSWALEYLHVRYREGNAESPGRPGARERMPYLHRDREPAWGMNPQGDAASPCADACGCAALVLNPLWDMAPSRRPCYLCAGAEPVRGCGIYILVPSPRGDVAPSRRPCYLRAGAELANGCSISITVLSRLDQQRLYSGEAWRYCTTGSQPPLTLLEKAYTS